MREEYTDEEWAERVERFADPGGDSALHPETSDNPRNKPCPNCGAENVLTAKDVALGYQCDRCADLQERGGF
jgi:ribosomal protein S27AE